jgi:O-antigen/teichoic acid export membrane protein
MMSGFILDLNSKIDIIILSLFVGQEEIGIYSFAAMFAEGYYQFALVFRNLNAPKLSKVLYEEKSALSFIQSNTLIKQALTVSILGLLSILFYTFLVML